nr:hypothetical protein M3p_00034 [Serratia entomophila]ULG12346.1 hypothetical protein M3p_00050 [Serratia entomophila]
MLLAHGAFLHLAPGLIAEAELRVAVGPHWHTLTVLFPQQMACYPFAAELHVGGCPVGSFEVAGVRVRGRIEPAGKVCFGDIGGQGPADTRGFEALGHLLESADADISALTYLAKSQPCIKAESQDFTNFAHVDSLVWHNALS